MNAVVERKEAQPVAVSEAAAILSMIERAARDQSVDIDKFERLMTMRERMESRAKEEAFNAAMAAVQNELPAIIKDRANDFTRSKYATLDAIVREAGPIYTRHGFSLSFGTEQSSLPGHYRVTCIVSHVGGFSRPYAADLPADLAGSQGKTTKTAIQAFGSTLSYGRRYLMCLIFNIAVTNEDDDGNGYRQQQSQQQRKSSAQSKRDGDWERFQRALLDCQSAREVERLHEEYKRDVYPTWKQDWQDVAEEDFQKRLVMFSASDLKGTLADSIEDATGEVDTPTPAQVMELEECKKYIGAATSKDDWKSRSKQPSVIAAAERLTVHQRNQLREFTAWVLQDIKERETA